MRQHCFEALAALFPNPRTAPSEDAPLAYGGNLEPLTLLAAYSRGLFPWFNEGDPIFWWSPDPRCILLPQNFRLPRRSARTLRNKAFFLTFNAAFDRVLAACAAPRKGHAGTWITRDMARAYTRLHRAGYVHSVEAWRDGELAGGIYGLALGRAFFGESMFHHVPEAGRAALAGLVALLVREGFHFLDCQQESPHMLAMGAASVARSEFLDRLELALAPDRDGFSPACPWQPWLDRYAHIAGQWLKLEPEP